MPAWNWLVMPLTFKQLVTPAIWEYSRLRILNQVLFSRSDSLLAEHERGGKTLENAAADLAVEWSGSALHALQCGTMLGRYRIEALLGEGGMGVVYRAYDSTLERPLAIKVVQPPLKDERSHARLLEEARSASALSHPNVCAVYEVGEEANYGFIAMEYVEGRRLSERMTGAPLLIDEAISYGLQIADALAHAHERGVVHGDLKAENMIVSGGGRIKVVDFGLARRHFADKTTASTTGQGFRGTAYAMAPEQWREERGDKRSDVWAFGVLLYEMLSGSRPFAQEMLPELMSAILHSSPAPLPDTVRFGLRRIVERCLAKNPEQRYQGGSELRSALDAVSGEADTVRLSDATSQSEASCRVRLPPALEVLPSSRTSSVQLVGRQSEMAALMNAWTHVQAGQRQLVLVSGEPGIGKTRLTTEFARARHAEGASVLLGRCDQEALVAYQPFVEALEWYLRHCPVSLLQMQLQEAGGEAELGNLIPEIARRGLPTPEAVQSNPEGRRYRLFEAVANLLCLISRTRPLLVVLDDMHWSDLPTLLMLRHLLRSSQRAAMCLVATYRETELDRTHPLSEMLADFRREEAATRVALSGLNSEQVKQFIHAWTGHEALPRLTELVFRNTEGNPFFMGEVLRHLSETGTLEQLESSRRRAVDELGVPEGVKEVVGRRLARLSEPCNRALTLGAVIGREFSFSLLQALTEFPEDVLLDLLDEALDAKIVQDAPGVPGLYTFTHALIRETLYNELTAARRARLHQRVAHVLEQRAVSGRESLADIAYHYGQAASIGDVDKTVDYAIRAGEQAAAALALEEAARFYEIAIQALDFRPDDSATKARQCELHARRGRAFADVGQWAPARTEFEAALGLLDPAERERRCELLIELAKTAFWLLDTPGMWRFAGEALDIAPTLHRNDLWADAMGWMGSAHAADGHLLNAIETERQALARRGTQRSYAQVRASLSLYWVGRTQESVEEAAHSAQAARSAQDPAFQVHALSHFGLILTGAGCYDKAERTFDEARNVGKRYGVFPLVARAISMSTGIHMNLFDFKGAEAAALEARDLAHRFVFVPPLVSAGIDLVLVYARCNDPGRAEPLINNLTRLIEEASGWHGWLWRLRFSQACAELALARGDYAAATEEARHTIDQNPVRVRPKYKALGLMTRARARLAQGDKAGGIEDAAQAVAAARPIGDPSLLLQTIALLLELDGTDELAVEARASVDRILRSLSDQMLRTRFLESAPIGTVLRLARNQESTRASRTPRTPAPW
jgi:tetratricopeptide (TPR) repeat protein/predicted Ser/Thr protein kinase